jgi:cellulose biosynthesis protein BcsQ
MCDFKQQFQIQIDTIVDVLGEKSDADWELVAVPDENIDVCRGHLAMADLQSELVVRRRSEHVLAQKLRNCPLPHDIILLDCPATLGKIILARNLKSLDRDCLSISSSNYAEEL